MPRVDRRSGIAITASRLGWGLFSLMVLSWFATGFNRTVIAVGWAVWIAVVGIAWLTRYEL
jgi:hypothetical protein